MVKNLKQGVRGWLKPGVRVWLTVCTYQTGVVVPARPGGQLQPLLEVLRHELVRHHVEEHAEK